MNFKEIRKMDKLVKEWLKYRKETNLNISFNEYLAIKKDSN